MFTQQFFDDNLEFLYNANLLSYLSDHVFIRWFKEENEQLLPLQLSERIIMVSAGLLKLTKVRWKTNFNFIRNE